MFAIRRKRSVTGYGPMSKYMVLRSGPIPDRVPHIPIPQSGTRAEAVNAQFAFCLDPANIAVVELLPVQSDRHGHLMQSKRIVMLRHQFWSVADQAYCLCPDSIDLLTTGSVGALPYSAIIDRLLDTTLNAAAIYGTKTLTYRYNNAIQCVGTKYSRSGYLSGYAETQNPDSTWTQHGDAGNNNMVQFASPVNTNAVRLTFANTDPLKGFATYTDDLPSFDVPVFTHAIWLGTALPVPALMSEISYAHVERGLQLRDLEQHHFSNHRQGGQSAVFRLPYLLDAQRA